MRKLWALLAAIEKSFIHLTSVIALSSLILVSAAYGQSGSSYVDSQLRFTISVPPGWVARPFNAGGVSGVTIAHGADAYVQIFLQKGIDPASFLNALNNGIQTNHPGYKISDRGVKDVKGQSRMFIVGESPVSANAPHTQVYLETFAGSGYTFAVIISASDQKPPSNQKIADYQVAQGMIQSLSMNGVVAHGSSPSQPPPAKVPPPEIKPPPQVETASNSNLTDDQKKLAALDALEKSGSMTREEYIAKKNALLSEQASQQAHLAKLKILDQAFESGVLTKEEYERKKRELGLDVPPSTSGTEPVQMQTVSSTSAPEAVAAPPPPSSADLRPTPVPSPTPAPSSQPAAAPAPAPAPTIAPTPSPGPTTTSSSAPVPTSTPAPTVAIAPAPAPSPQPAPAPVAPAPMPAEAPVAKSEPKIKPAPGSWITHTDPTGFEVSLPATWTVDEAQSNGQVFLRGTSGEEILIWPLRVQKPQLNSRDTLVLTQSLALRFDALMPWSPVQITRNTARTIGIGGQRTATSILSWADNPNGASAYFCAVEAPSNIYENSVESFVAILKSFHTVSNSPMRNLLPTASAIGKVFSFVNWTDPHEGAFDVSVPQGWHAIGGTYRLSPLDVRYAVAMDSPDGQLRASIGDSMVGEFTQPTPALKASGLNEGNYQLLDDGSKLEVLQYMSGQKFVRSYVDTLVSRQCSHPQITYSAPREDLASVFSQSAVEEGFKDGFLTAGEVTFSCSLDGRVANGKFVAATMRIGHDEPSMWFVYRLYGYVALVGREQDGEKILTEILQTLKFKSKWQELKKTVTDPVVERENPFSQQIQQRAEEDIIDDQRQISEMMARSYEQRKRVFDAIDHKLENAVLGTVEVVDRENGTRYKISDFGDYHFMTNDAYIFSMNAPGASEATLRELLVMPPGI
ncbi:MAG TPA: SHOCT domain-containing protein [Candidatus Saccharimonadales bacterium]|jgi:hypothetical protein|nr:SHOCT domain-containing protein [Candidatus Saccharimonadales bacterium]